MQKIHEKLAPTEKGPEVKRYMVCEHSKTLLLKLSLLVSTVFRVHPIHNVLNMNLHRYNHDIYAKNRKDIYVLSFFGVLYAMCPQFEHICNYIILLQNKTESMIIFEPIEYISQICF